MYIKKTGLVIFLMMALILSGCGRTDEEKLVDVCVEGLKDKLKDYARYDGWVVKNPTTYLYKMEKNEEKSAKYETLEIWDFEVLITDFTVKNGFNADVRSTSSCTGTVYKNKDGNYDPPEKLLLNHTLNGQKLGIL